MDEWELEAPTVEEDCVVLVEPALEDPLELLELPLVPQPLIRSAKTARRANRRDIGIFRWVSDESAARDSIHDERIPSS